MKKEIKTFGKIGDLEVSTFFKFTTKKILIDALISVILVLLIFFTLPVFRNIFLSNSLFLQIIDVIFNTLIFMIIFYTLSCYLSLKLFYEERK